MTPLPYEIAKALKDHGWPQPQNMPRQGSGHISVDASGNIIDAGSIDHTQPYSPSLEELIEACPPTSAGGYDLAIKFESPGKWWVGWINDYNPFVYGSEGKTLKEAVANFWLALVKEGLSTSLSASCPSERGVST